MVISKIFFGRFSHKTCKFVPLLGSAFFALGAGQAHYSVMVEIPKASEDRKALVMTVGGESNLVWFFLERKKRYEKVKGDAICLSSG